MEAAKNQFLLEPSSLGASIYTVPTSIAETLNFLRSAPSPFYFFYCLPTPANSFTIVRGVASGSSQSPAIAACFALMGRFHAHRFRNQASNLAVDDKVRNPVNHLIFPKHNHSLRFVDRLFRKLLFSLVCFYDGTFSRQFFILRHLSFFYRS